MVKSLVIFTCGAAVMLALVAVPANAADELEAKLQSCNACHGENGQPISATIPTIWGQQQSYLVKQLHDYRTEDRHNPIMSPIAGTVSPSEWRKTAAHFAAKTWPAKTSPATPTPAAAAAAPNGTALCEKCHQEKFVGGMPAPRLAGLSYEYLIAAMNSFANDERTNNADMATLMKGLSAGERDAMARYIAGL
jgi:cytochrome c553